jgi:hypothetical protein
MLKNRLLKDFSVVLAAAAGAGAAAAVVVASSTVPAAAAALGFTSRVATTSARGDTGPNGAIKLKGFPVEVGGAIFEIKFNNDTDIEKISGTWTENPSVEGQEPESDLLEPFLAWDANVHSDLWDAPTYDLVEFSPENPTEITRIKDLRLPSKQTTTKQDRDFKMDFWIRQADYELMQGFFRFRDEDGDSIRYEGYATSNFGADAPSVSVAEPSLTLGFITLASLMLGSRKKKEAKKT